MKFCQIIVPAMITIMHTATIFGVEKHKISIEKIIKETMKRVAKNPFEVENILQYFSEYLPLYKETAHLKPYPPYLRDMLVYRVIFGEFVDQQVGYFEAIRFPWSKFSFFLGITAAVFIVRRAYMDPLYRTLREVKSQYESTKEIEALYEKITDVAHKMKVEPLLKKLRALESKAAEEGITEAIVSQGIGAYRRLSLSKGILGALFPMTISFPIQYLLRESNLSRKIMIKLFKYRTYIRTSPLRIVMFAEGDEFCVTGNSPVLILNTPYYRIGCRSLSDMSLRWQRLLDYSNSKLDEIKKENDKERKRGKLIYKLENGKVNIYRSTKHLESGDKMSSIGTEQDITAFDISLDGKTMITGSKDGIRKWELSKQVTKKKIGGRKKLVDIDQ